LIYDFIHLLFQILTRLNDNYILLFLLPILQRIQLNWVYVKYFQYTNMCLSGNYLFTFHDICLIIILFARCKLFETLKFLFRMVSLILLHNSPYNWVFLNFMGWNNYIKFNYLYYYLNLHFDILNDWLLQWFQ